MGRSLGAGLLTAVVSLPAAAQQAPVPDPRVERLVNTLVIAEVNRSAQLERAFPQPVAPLENRRRPQVNEPELVRAAEGLYIERSLVPGRAPEDPGAVRVFPRDAR